MGHFPGGKSPKIKCKARSSRTGEPCKKWAVHGALVCNTHGAGGTVQNNRVKAKAVERVEDAEAQLRAHLFDMKDAAMDAIRSILEDPLTKPADKLKAADAVLDRMIPRKAETKVTVSDSEERDLDEEILASLGVADEDIA